MSYCANIKKELCAERLKNSSHRLCELAGLTYCCGALRISHGLSAVFRTEQMSVAKRIAALGSELYALDVSMELTTAEHRKRPVCEIALSGGNIRKMLKDIALFGDADDGLTVSSRVPAQLLDSDDSVRAFIRGCFLGSGICLDPARRYQLEIICQSAAFSRDLMLLLSRYDISAHPTLRQNRFVVYTKDGDSVMRFLALIGANVAAMEFENVRAVKETRNYANRTRNCDTGNLEKAAVASARQLAAIGKIMERMPLGELPPSLYDAAKLRIEHPEATLGEMAEFAGIRKSGMNHRLQRLMQLAEELKQ